MNVSYIINSIFNSITYIVPIGNHSDCWLVDCGDVDKVIEKGWNIKGVFLTHAHFDHIYGLNRLLEMVPDAEIYTNVCGKEALINPKQNFSRYHEETGDFVLSVVDNVSVINNDDIIEIDSDVFVNVIETPGHDPSCLSYKIGNNLFTGDSYIPGIKVVTNFPRSNKQQALESLEKLKQIEAEGCIVHCGHHSY